MIGFEGLGFVSTLDVGGVHFHSCGFLCWFRASWVSFILEGLYIELPDDFG